MSRYLTPNTRPEERTLYEAFEPFGRFGPPKAPGHQAPLPMGQMPYAPGVDPALAKLYTEAYGAPAPGGEGGGGGGGGGFGLNTKDYEEALRQIKAQADELAKKQAAGADPLRQDLARQMAAGGDLQYDLSPLAALVDNWTGSNLAQSYKDPETGQQRQQTLRGLQSGISQAESGAESTKLQALKAMADGTFDLQKFKADQAYKNATLDLQKKELEAKKAGAGRSPRYLGEKAVNDYTEFQGVVEMADGLDSVIAQGASLMGPVEGRKAMNPWNSPHKKLQAEFDLVRQKIGKMVEGGVLRKEDEEKYTKILPSITDKPEVARDKARRFSALMRKDISRYMSNLGRAGYDVSGFASDTAGYQQDLAGGDEGGGANEWGLAPGQVVSGRKYLGGDPNQRTSWE